MATVLPTAGGTIDTVEGSGPSIVILVAMMIIFGAAAFFTGRLYGRNGMLAVIAGFFVVVIGALFTGRLCTSANQSYRSGVARLACHAIPKDEYPAGARSGLLSPSSATTSTVLWQRSLQRNGAPAEPLGFLIQRKMKEPGGSIGASCRARIGRRQMR